MEGPVFGNEFFDQWLNQKSNEILSKVEHEKISTEDMLVLSLKAQVNHFHHMDIEFREEFKKIEGKFDLIEQRFDQQNARFDQQISLMDGRLDRQNVMLDKRFDRQNSMMMWAFALFITSQLGILFKLYFPV